MKSYINRDLDYTSIHLTDILHIMLILYAILFFLLLALFIGLCIAFGIMLLFIFPMSQGAVYVPSKDSAIETMLKLGKVKKGIKSVDLGSGDGRVVAAFAQAGAQADGYEINPWLVFKARRLLYQLGLGRQTSIKMQSYWNIDLGEYDVISVYGITYIMEGLEKKLRAELRPGTIVVSNYFQFPTWKARRVVNGVRQYVV